jgi:FMN phosphatase YigB (HAD superfamily)
MHPSLKSIVFIDLDKTILSGVFPTVVFPTLFGEMSRKTGLSSLEIQTLVFEENFRRQTDPHCPAMQAMDWDDIFATISGRLNLHLERTATEICLASLQAPNVWALDGAAEMLTALKSNSRALVVATNGLQKYQFPTLEALQLTPYFADILTPDRSNCLKTCPEFYADWANKAVIRIMLGDRYDDDVLSSKALGFFSIWKTELSEIEESFSPTERATRYRQSVQKEAYPDAIVAGLSEVPQVVFQIEANAL